MTEFADIRALRPEDRGAWARLWDGYLKFYRQPLPASTTEQTFADLCAGRHGLFALVAVDDAGVPIGLSHAVVHATTWSSHAASRSNSSREQIQCTAGWKKNTA